MGRMMPNELLEVPSFDPVLVGYYRDGRPYPDAMHQQAEHRGTLREFAIAQALINEVSDVWAEFGVENGTSARYFLQHLPKNGKFFLFDSFRGLPEPWVRGTKTRPKGHRCAVEVPQFDDPRVEIVPGWFCDTLPLDDLLGFVHIDCDLYSSTKEVLDNIRVASGTIILFDELFGYDGWEGHEYKALSEYDRPYKFIGRDDKYRAAIEIL